MSDGPPAGTLGTPSHRRFLAGSAGVVALAAAACTAEKPAAAPAAPTPATFDETRAAGGFVGWAGMAVLGAGQSNKIFIMDARSHKTVTTIYWLDTRGRPGN